MLTIFVRRKTGPVKFRAEAMGTMQVHPIKGEGIIIIENTLCGQSMKYDASTTSVVTARYICYPESIGIG